MQNLKEYLIIQCFYVLCVCALSHLLECASVSGSVFLYIFAHLNAVTALYTLFLIPFYFAHFFRPQSYLPKKKKKKKTNPKRNHAGDYNFIYIQNSWTHNRFININLLFLFISLLKKGHNIDSVINFIPV